jgi:hypothetical protein
LERKKEATRTEMNYRKDKQVGKVFSPGFSIISLVNAIADAYNGVCQIHELLSIALLTRTVCLLVDIDIPWSNRMV